MPSNEVLTLQYRQDPSSASSALATCSNSCPLSHDSSIPYEDFVIASASNTGRSPMTGFEITLLSHYGSTSGLHLLQLLSSGTTAYAIDTQNEGYGRGICTSGPGSVYGRSSSTHQPTPQVPWDHVEVTSSTIAGTSEGALCAAVPVNEDSNNAPTATWYPYIGQDGTYELYFFTPACAFDATCGQRGAVDVEVAITGSTSASTSTTITTINQEVDQDLSSLIYSGPINPIADSAEVKVTMKLSDTERPALAPGKGDKYYLVADKIVTVAKDTDGNGSDKMKIGTGMNSVNVTTADNTHPLVQYEVGYGLFEWKISDTITISPTLDEALTIPQEMKNIQSASSIDRFAFGFENGAKIDHVLSLPNESGYVLAGEFSTSTSSSSGTLQNIVMVNVDGSLAQNTQRGLNGPITSLILDGQYIYAAGRFTATSDGSLTNLQGRARQTFSSGAWEAVPGVTTNVNSTFIAAASNDKLFIAYSGAPADLWYTTNSSMVNTADRPLVIGNFSSSSLSNDGKGVYLAGSLSALAQSPSSGSAIITKDGLVPINFGFQLASPPSDSNQASATSPAKRTMLPASSLMSTLKNKLRKRQSGNTLPAPSSLPITPFLSPSEPVINAGAHWKNASAKDEEVTILGGRFVSQDGTVTDIGILHADGTFVPLKGDSNATGDVKALYVADNLLFIGRSDSADGALSVYDLAAQQWRTSDIVSAMITTATTSILPSVNVIIGTEDAVIVTGYFENLNNVVGCNGVCEWRKETKAWNALESGVEGVAATMATSKASIAVHSCQRGRH